MAVAYESIASTTHSAGTSTVITKPTGLAVGDGMIAGILVDSAATTLSAPAGWTAEYNANYVSGTTTLTYGIFTKVADSADAAASNFTFTTTGGGVNRVSGFIIRASDYGGVNVKNAVVPTATAPGSPSFASGIDPTVADTLNLFITFGGENSGTPPTFSAQAIATSNPTWTDRASTSGSSYGWEVATAIRAADTAWGNASYTFTGSAGTDSLAVFLVLQTKVNGAHTVTTAPMYVVNQPFLRSGAITMQGNDPDVLSFNKTDWQNETPGSTTWVNEEY